MDHFIALARLPEEIRFPDDMRDRIRYDEANQRLVFQGFMSKAEFDRLNALSGDWAYRRALETLFRISTPAHEAPPGPLGRIRSIVKNLGFH